jgi:hypothetical protein
MAQRLQKTGDRPAEFRFLMINSEWLTKSDSRLQAPSQNLTNGAQFPLMLVNGVNGNSLELRLTFYG